MAGQIWFEHQIFSTRVPACPRPPSPQDCLGSAALFNNFKEQLSQLVDFPISNLSNQLFDGFPLVHPSTQIKNIQKHSEHKHTQMGACVAVCVRVRSPESQRRIDGKVAKPKHHPSRHDMTCHDYITWLNHLISSHIMFSLRGVPKSACVFKDRVLKNSLCYHHGSPWKNAINCQKHWGISYHIPHVWLNQRFRLVTPPVLIQAGARVP
jgi:hypothetical protein